MRSGYDRNQRAYVLQCKKPAMPSPIEFVLAASEASPVINPAFVIHGWGDAGATLTLNGRPVKRGLRFRFGHRHRLDATDLIVWSRIESTEPVRVRLSPILQ